MRAAETGFFAGGTPYLAVGEGPPLVKVVGLTPTCEVPAGAERRMVMSSVGPLCDTFRVYVVNRKPNLRPGESMSDIAGHLAESIEAEFGGPVLLTGTSTGGSVVLQLAVDRPDLVRALVVVAAAYRLGPIGRQLQQDLAASVRAGRAADGWAKVMTAMLPGRLQGPAQPLTSLLARSMARGDTNDLLVTLEAEDVFDVGERLPRISARTLVIGGAKDRFYGRALFERTAAGIPHGQAHIYPAWGHMRTSASATTGNLTLGFMLAALGI